VASFFGPPGILLNQIMRICLARHMLINGLIFSEVTLCEICVTRQALTPNFAALNYCCAMLWLCKLIVQKAPSLHQNLPIRDTKSDPSRNEEGTPIPTPQRMLSFISNCVNSDCDIVKYLRETCISIRLQYVPVPLGRNALYCGLRYKFDI